MKKILFILLLTLLGNNQKSVSQDKKVGLSDKTDNLLDNEIGGFDDLYSGTSNIINSSYNVARAINEVYDGLIILDATVHKDYRFIRYAARKKRLDYLTQLEKQRYLELLRINTNLSNIKYIQRKINNLLYLSEARIQAHVEIFNDISNYLKKLKNVKENVKRILNAHKNAITKIRENIKNIKENWKKVKNATKKILAFKTKVVKVFNKISKVNQVAKEAVAKAAKATAVGAIGNSEDPTSEAIAREVKTGNLIKEQQKFILEETLEEEKQQTIFLENILEKLKTTNELSFQQAQDIAILAENSSLQLLYSKLSLAEEELDLQEKDLESLRLEISHFQKIIKLRNKRILNQFK